MQVSGQNPELQVSEEWAGAEAVGTVRADSLLQWFGKMEEGQRDRKLEGHVKLENYFPLKVEDLYLKDIV